ncbi:universal stress protein UspA [Caulobacter zeae]|uniref:Universal stress protein UspA n=1 Tax=Caulobacter zeae TaxID=2055137 RepID=A0A2N5DRF6_9CAUL|nr:universal stress protein [Caulobacter zeae]PLR28637.1 universal stress protein UspA [Caulobacter zeae]
MKTILLPVHEDAGQEARFQTALDLTRALRGHLTCVDIVPPPLAGGDIATAAYLMVLEEQGVAEAANRQALQGRLAHEGVDWDWIDAAGAFAQSLMREADLADLIVVNCTRDLLFAPEPRRVVTQVLGQARCPIVAAPDHCSGFDAYGPAIVAWDGSAPAGAALRGAVPLLGLASSVALLTVDERTSGPSVESAAAYLSRHGVHAEIVRLDGRGETADALILRACAVRKAGYCVMGAFGHGRLSGELFGGVTRRMLDAARTPLVMSR